MATERETRVAERARLEGLVDEHGTESEKASLLSGIVRSGITLTRLVEAAEADEPTIGRLPPEPDELARIARRVDRRTRLKLPQAKCAADPSAAFCTCLERALDQPGDEGKRGVLKLAAAFHKRKEDGALDTAPREVSAEPQEANGSAEDPSVTPEPEPEPPPEPKPKTAPPARVIHRSRRWYDEAEGRVPFDQMTF